MDAYKTAMERAMKIQEVILRAMAKRITWWQAAEILGFSDRHLRRIRERYEQFGYESRFDKRRGQPSPKRVPYTTVEKVLALYREEYFDLNVRHFHEKLREPHAIELSYSWVKTVLQGAGRVARQRQRGVHRKRRPRRPLPGLLLHIDGSPHRWFQDERWYAHTRQESLQEGWEPSACVVLSRASQPSPLQREVTNRIQQTLKLRHGIFAQPLVNFVPLDRTIVPDGAAQQAGDILYRQLMILLHSALKSVPIQSARFGQHEGLQFRPEAHRIRTHLPGAGLYRGRRYRRCVSRVTTFVPVPRRFKACKHTQHFQHHGAAMGETLPRAEGAEDTPINIFCGVGNEDLVGSNFAPGDKLIKEAVRRNTPIMNALFCSLVGHNSSL